MNRNGVITINNDLRCATITNESSTYQVTNVHMENECASPCVLHDPSDHHMRDWALIFRGDKMGLMERQCEHGIGHPDPDSLAYFSERGLEWMGVHGCDGCCSPNSSP